MKEQHICLWTGGQAGVASQCQSMANALPLFPAPMPLHPSALIEYHWGEMKFEIVVTACAVRTTQWGSERMNWLHCKAMQTSAINVGGSTSLMNVLIPAHYVTTIQPGPTFQLLRSRKTKDLGVFPPNQPTPEDALPLEEIEAVLIELLVPDRN